MTRLQCAFAAIVLALLVVPATQAQSTKAAATRFAPVAGDDSVRKLADSLGNTPEERQQILQHARAWKELCRGR